MSKRPKQLCEPGNGMSPPGRCSHRGSPAGAGNTELTAAAENAGGTPSPGHKIREIKRESKDIRIR